MPRVKKRFVFRASDEPIQKKDELISQSDAEKKLAGLKDLELKVRGSGNKKVILKSAKKVRKTRNVMGPEIHSSVWIPIVREVFKDSIKESKVDLVFNALDSGRVDVIPGESSVYKDWRMTIMSFLGGEFSVSYNFDFSMGWNVKSLKVEFIKLTLLKDAIQFVMENQLRFADKERDSNGSSEG